MELKKFQLVTIDDPNYESARALIESTYHKAFQSNVTPRPTLILTLADQSGTDTKIIACATLSHGEGRSFFSERYLGEPVELAISKVLGWSVDREHVMEVGGLAASQNGAGTHLISHTPWFVLGLGYRFGLVTATRQVRFLLRRAGMDFLPIAAAHRESLPEGERAQWGSYYDNKPITGVIDFLASCQAVAVRRTLRYSVHEMSMSVQDLKVG